MPTLSNVYLVWWTPERGAEPPLVSEVQMALDVQGFDADRASLVPASTAFRRAVKAREGKDQSDNVIKATIWQNGQLHGVLEKQTPEGEGENAKLKREQLKHWRLKENDNGTFTVSGPEDDALDIAPFINRFTWADVSTVIQNVLKTDGVGAYSPKKTGGIYFVPTPSLDFIQRLGTACASFHLSVLRYDIPDVPEQRAEIADSVSAAMTTDLDAHEQAIAAYTPEQTKAGVVNNRREAIVASRQLIDRLSLFLGDNHQTLLQRCARLDKQCGRVIEAIQSYRAPASGGRRLVMTPAVEVAVQS